MLHVSMSSGLCVLAKFPAANKVSGHVELANLLAIHELYLNINNSWNAKFFLHICFKYYIFIINNRYTTLIGSSILNKKRDNILKI